MTDRKMINDYFNKLFNTQFNYFTWEGFGILWEWAKEQVWFDPNKGDAFLQRCDEDYHIGSFDIECINPEVLATRLYWFVADGDRSA